jgi:hypothetical protein
VSQQEVLVLGVGGCVLDLAVGQSLRLAGRVAALEERSEAFWDPIFGVPGPFVGFMRPRRCR